MMFFKILGAILLVYIIAYVLDKLGLFIVDVIKRNYKK